MKATPHMLSAADREDAALALLRAHLGRPPRSLRSNTPDGSVHCPPAPDDGLREELMAFLSRFPGAEGLFRVWLVDFGGKDWLLYRAARKAGVTGGRAKRLVHQVLTVLIERMGRGEG